MSGRRFSWTQSLPPGYGVSFWGKSPPIVHPPEEEEEEEEETEEKK